MRYFLLFVSLIWLSGVGYGQTPVSLPINFEGGTVTNDNFGDIQAGLNGFGGTEASVVSNPPAPGNTSVVGKIERFNQSWGGAFLNLSDNLDFASNPIITMRVFTNEPAGSVDVHLKMEDPDTGQPERFRVATITQSGVWETITFDYTGEPNAYNRMTFLFDRDQPATGTIFYFDDIEQPELLDGFELALPIDFEGNDFEGNLIDDDNFGDIGGGFNNGTVVANGFDDGAATVETNIQSAGNPSSKVGQIIRHAGSTTAGAYIDLPEALVLDLDPILCMNVFTTADVDTEITLRIEDSSNSSIFMESVALTTVSGGWDTLCFVFHNAPPTCDRLTFYFDRGNTGDGSASSTFLFDDIYQPLTPSSSTIFFTPGSQFFCPPSSFTFTYPEDGEYKWFDENGVVVATGPDFTTPLLGGTTPFFVQDTASVALPQTDVGPTLLGARNIISGPASIFFASNLENGFWYGVDLVQVIIGTPGPNCTYIVTGHNAMAGPPESITQIFANVPPTFPDNVQRTFEFENPIPMDLGDEMELTVTVSGSGCSLSSFTGYDNITPTSYPKDTNGGELTFTGYSAAGVTANTRWMGFDYQVSGDLLADPTIYQVNAIADCASPLPIQLIDFSVREDNGDALLIWSTASELNNDRFLLLRTVDGIEYETAGIVSGAGNSSTVINYSFRDRNPEKGLSYYKLRQVDFDGTKTDSEPVAYTNDTSGEFRLFPNPTHRNLTLSTALPYEQVDVIIYDLSGRVINRLNYGAIENQDFELEGHPGTYFVEILVDGERKAIFNVLKL
ncbi:MAG: hypothetical protein ACJAXD_002176 [Cryomorphaceae bacterium]|jgi:hypothetical protein